jgi:uncharacterized protein YceK
MRLFVLGLLVMLSGCGTLGDVINQDLTGASAKAAAAGDVEGKACWDCLLKANANPSQSFGFATGIEQSRLVHTCRAPCANVFLP